MTNCIFYSVIFMLFLTFTTGSIQYSKINRTFMSIYRGLFEASTISVDNDGNSIEPYYSETILAKYITDYFKENLASYCKEYTFTIRFFSREDFTYCFENCRDVNVTLNAKINYLFEYNKSQDFSVYQRGEL